MTLVPNTNQRELNRTVSDFLEKINNLNNEIEELRKEVKRLTELKKLPIHDVSGRSEQLCRTFAPDGATSSATKCVFCGRTFRFAP
jgi:hypothetical protein